MNLTQDKKSEANNNDEENDELLNKILHDPKLAARVATAWLMQNNLYCISESDWHRIYSKKKS